MSGPSVSEITLEIERIAAVIAVDPSITFSVARDDILQTVMLRAARDVASFRGTDEIRVPATWWDAVKERFLPRLGVQHRVITARALLPSVPIPSMLSAGMFRVLTVAEPYVGNDE